ncbi:YgjV family protein [Agarivorans sp. QJM3NY_29]|uniref:YgjV family protein n=1 Tax=unclassified Agarivorans TaxID=2636026 RepID=UPI003D7E2B65
MSLFLISQLFVAVAICFDFMSFQFRERAKIVTCLFCAGILISLHFALLGQWTATSLMGIATIRYFVSIFSSSAKLKYLFCFTSVLATVLTYAGVASMLSCLGSVFQTVAAFNSNDQRLRQLMIVGTCFWLAHNYLVGSPTAVLMEVLFITSNLIGYYRHYYRNTSVA